MLLAYLTCMEMCMSGARITDGNYDQTPVDGSAWITDDKEANRIRRGGSWDRIPRICRSAYRNNYTPDNRNFRIRFSSELFSPQDLIALYPFCAFALFLVFSLFSRAAGSI